MCDASCHARDWRHLECRTWPVVRGREAFSWGSAAVPTRLPAVVSAPFLRPPVHPRPRLPASRSGSRALSASGCLNVEPSRPMPVAPSEAEGHATALPAQRRPLCLLSVLGVSVPKSRAHCPCEGEGRPPVRTGLGLLCAVGLLQGVLPQLQEPACPLLLSCPAEGRAQVRLGSCCCLYLLCPNLGFAAPLFSDCI